MMGMSETSGTLATLIIIYAVMWGHGYARDALDRIREWRSK